MTDKTWDELFNESGESAGPLPDAEYDFVVRKATSKKTSNGKPMYMARCEVETGQYAKRTIFHNFVVSAESPDAMRIFFQQMGALGMTKEFWRQNPSDDRVCQALEGRRFRASTTIRQWQGEDRNNLQRIKAAAQGVGTGAPPPPPVAGPGAPPAPAPQAQAAPPPPPTAVSPSPEAPGQPGQPVPTAPDRANPSVPATAAPDADPTQPANPASAPTTNPTQPPSAPQQTPSAPTQAPSAPTQVPSSIQANSAPVPPAPVQTNGHTPAPQPNAEVEAATQAAEHYAAQGAAPQGSATLPPPPAVQDPPF